MRRLSICLGALVLLVSVGACGRSEPQQAAAPSLTVKVHLTVQLKGHRVTGITLTPSGQPSGTVALKTVHDGRVKTIGSQRFRKLSAGAFLAVQISPRDIELGWNIQGCSRAAPLRSLLGRPGQEAATGTKPSARNSPVPTTPS